MYPHVVAGVCWGLSLGELMIPNLLNLFNDQAMAWLGFCMLGTTLLCLGLFLCSFLIARKHESRCVSCYNCYNCYNCYYTKVARFTLKEWNCKQKGYRGIR
jgi:hypothetical protein